MSVVSAPTCGAASNGLLLPVCVIAGSFLTLGNLITRQGSFFLYAAIGVGAFIFFLTKVHETKDRTLEQLQDDLNIAAVHPPKETA